MLVGLILWFQGVKVSSASMWGLITTVIINAPSVWSIGKGVMKVMALGPKQAELDQRTKKRLLEIEQSQLNSIDTYLKTIVASVGYKKGALSTAPFIDMHILFINLLFSTLNILSCRIYIASPDESQINCLGTNNQIEPKEIVISNNGDNIKPASIKKIDLRIYIPDTVMQRIKDSATKQSKVQYCVHVQWKLNGENFDNRIPSAKNPK